MKDKILNIYVPILIGFILYLFLIISLIDKYSIGVLFTFIANILLLTIFMIKILKKGNMYFEIILCIFYILFYIIAPIIQLNRGQYPIPFHIKEGSVIKANIINFVFLFVFILVRWTNFKINKNTLETNDVKKKWNISKLTFLILVLIFLVIFIPNIKNIFLKILYRSSSNNGLEKGMNLIIAKCIYFIPLMFVYNNIIKYKEKKIKFIWLLFSFILLIFCKNPFTEKRNGLAPIYLSILIYYFFKNVRLRRFFIGTLIIIIIIFPLSSIITHSKISLNDIKSGNMNVDLNMIIDQFHELHYDAYANLNLTFEVVQEDNIQFGRQLLGSVLFFVPRSIWASKPVSSGELLGDYLIENYGYNFNNLSCTITAEAYLNGKYIGVIVFAVILAIISKYVCELIEKDGYYLLVGMYISVHMFFLLRGDLMNGIAYLVGPLLAIYIIPLILERIVALFKMRKYKNKGD